MMNISQLSGKNFQHLKNDTRIGLSKILKFGNRECVYERISQDHCALFSRVIPKRGLYSKKLTGFNILRYLCAGFNIERIKCNMSAMQQKYSSIKIA